MSDTKFTPGPWEPSLTPAGKGKVIDGKGFAVANCSASTYKQQVVDSYLISAAPELYSSLQAAMRFIDCHVGDPDMTKEMIDAYWQLQESNPHEALAKARGEK